MTKKLFVQFGGTGNLARKKLYPAYSNLAKKGYDFQVLALGRRYSNSHDFFSSLSLDSDLNKRMHYLQFDLAEQEQMESLVSIMKKIVSKDTMVIFYLAVLPEFYEKVIPIIDNLKSKVLPSNAIKIVLEKPFGYDYKSAKLYDNKIKGKFEEKDIFRVDHYLGKEFIQNILIMRFTNEIISGIWNKNFVDHIQIILDETHGIEQRAEYYNKVGVVRDMVQNHILQIITHIMMEEPKDFTHEHISEQKVKLLKCITGIDDFALSKYDNCSSSISDCAPTYVALKLHTKTGVFANVPIYVRTGKKQSSSKSLIYVQFKNFMTKTEKREEIPPNSMIINIQPDMNIEFTMNVKKPGESWNAHPVKFNFNHADTFKFNTAEAYEQILQKVLDNDKTLFPSSQEIVESWRIVDELLNPDSKLISSYEMGKLPKNVVNLIEKDGRKWII